MPTLLEVAAPVVGFEEGFRPKTYFDTKGYPTIGHGFMMCRRTGIPLSSYENFSLSRRVSTIMLEELLADYVVEAEKRFIAQWKMMNDDRRTILLSMIHQLGVAGVLGFPSFLRAAAAGNWREAYNQMLDSKWYRKDTPERAMRHALVMYHGSIAQVYSGVIK